MSETPNGVYLYGITNAAMVGDQLVEAPLGLGDEPIFAVAIDGVGLAAVVSEAPAGRLRPQRRSLAAHQRVLTHLNRVGGALPASFGVVAPSVESVSRLLDRHADTLGDQLGVVAGCVEMTLRVRWDVENVFADFVSRHDELRSIRDRLASGAGRDDMIEAGQLFERLQNAERDETLGIVRSEIDCAVREIVSHSPRDERDVLNLACLIGVADESAFDAAVENAAERFDERFAFEIGGPMPAFSFVSLHLDFADDDRENEAALAYELVGPAVIEREAA